MIIGIDLGTTNSVCSYFGMKQDGSYGPILIKNSLNQVLTPSVVALDDEGNAVVGKMAREIQILHPDRAASVFKRYMDSERLLSLGKKKFSAISLSALVLSSLKNDAEHALGEKIHQAVVTVPAYFNDKARRATIEAGKIAGLHVERVLNEPTAAAIAYGLHESQDDTLAIVVDLGGGTFDVSVIERFEGVLEIKSSSGESFLGGEDFTTAMIRKVLESEKKSFEITEHKFPLKFSRLRQLCETAKTQLSLKETYDIKIPNDQGDLIDSGSVYTFTREMFEKITAPVLDRIRVPIMRALGDAKIERSDIKQVILVGGATRMPALRNLVKEFFKKEPSCHLNPDEVVAMGAGIQAGIISRNEVLDDYVVTDVAPHTLGIEVCKQFGKEILNGYFTPIINRNSTIPTSETEVFHTMEPFQTHVNIKVFQGESRKVSENLSLGEFVLSGFPPTKEPQSFSVRFTYDLNGILEIEAKILSSNHKITHVINNSKKKMSQEEIKQALMIMQSLKVNRREDDGNKYLIMRAERIYKEISTEHRTELARLLDYFEHALEGKDLDLLESVKSELENFLNNFDGEQDGME